MVNDSERTAAEPVVQSSLCWTTELLKTHMLTACQKTKSTLPTARTRPSYAGHRKNDLHTAAKTFLWMLCALICLISALIFRISALICLIKEGQKFKGGTQWFYTAGRQNVRGKMNERSNSSWTEPQDRMFGRVYMTTLDILFCFHLL